jgi:hypothetical protein
MLEDSTGPLFGDTQNRQYPLTFATFFVFKAVNNSPMQAIHVFTI